MPGAELECKCFMGLLPDIHRAWFTIDNQIFLWDYHDGTDFCVYDGLDQIIVSAALVPPRPGTASAHAARCATGREAFRRGGTPAARAAQRWPGR